MFNDSNYQKIAKYLILSYLCSVSVFTAVTVTAATPEDGENEGIYAENGNTTFINFSRQSTTKQYIREDNTVPTEKPENHSKAWISELLGYIVIAITFLGLFGFMLYFLIYYTLKIQYKGELKQISDNSHSHSSISSEKFNTFNRSSEHSDSVPDAHRPARGMNQRPDSRTEISGDSIWTDLLGELDINRGATHTTGIAVIDSSSATYSQGRRESVNAVTEMPPDYAAVILSDLAYPTSLEFPVVKKDCELPPPEKDQETENPSVE